MAINLPIISKFDNKGVKSAEGAFSGLGKSLTGLAALVATAFSVKAIVDFGKESILAAEGVATANARISTIAKSMGIFGDATDDVTKRLVEYAEANELSLAVDANVIKATQAKLLTFKELAGSADEVGGAFDRATMAAIDLAAAGFGTAESNAVQLGKALNDPIKGITALTRSGITFTEAEREKIKALTESGQVLEAQNMILAAIETQVGGTAAATANMSDIMGLAFKNIKETVGAALLPAFEEVGGALVPLIQDLLPKLESFINERIAPALMNFATGFSDLVGRFREGESIGDIFATMFQSISEWFTGGGFSSAFEGLMQLRQDLIQAILDALPGILEGLIAMLPSIISFIIDDLLPAMLSAFIMIIEQLADIFEQVMPQLIDALVIIVPQLVQALVDILPLLVDALMTMLPTILNAAIQLFTALVKALPIILPPLIQAVISLMPLIVNTLIGLLPILLEAAITLFTALIEALPIILPPLIQAVIGLMPDIISALISVIPQLIDGAVTLFTAIVEALPLIIPQLIPAVLGLIPVITGALIGAMPQLIKAGIDLLAGLAKGLIDNAPKIIGAAIKAVGDTLVSGFKSVLGINSPSKVFADLGGNVIDGLKLGIDKGEQLIKGASFDMAQNLTVSAKGALSSAAPDAVIGSPRTGSSAASSAPVYNITVNAGMGTDGNRVGEMIVNEILRFERSSGKVFARA